MYPMLKSDGSVFEKMLMVDDNANMVDTIEKPSIQVRLSLIFPLMLVRFAQGLKQIPRIYDSNSRPIVCDSRKRSG